MDTGMTIEQEKEIYNSLTNKEKDIMRSKSEDLSKIYPFALLTRKGKIPRDILENGMIYGEMALEYSKKYDQSLADTTNEIKVFIEFMDERIQELSVEDVKIEPEKQEQKRTGIKNTSSFGDIMKDKGIV